MMWTVESFAVVSAHVNTSCEEREGNLYTERSILLWRKEGN